MRDGHIHTKYCPHGSRDDFKKYIGNAISIGLNEITFTEHMPFPKGFEDPSPGKNSSMDILDIEDYIEDLSKLKEEYKNKIRINIGFEVDYIEGYEREIRRFLDVYGRYIDDAIISVHTLKVNDKYYVIDYRSEEFQNLVDILGGIDKVYTKYYETVKKAVESDLGEHKPKRIGHLNLIRKYCKVFPYDYSKNEELKSLVQAIKDNNYELDYNISGKRKEDCGEVYISGYLLDLVKRQDIKMILGSDSHSADEIFCLKEFI